jgi:hypothetical protein
MGCACAAITGQTNWVGLQLAGTGEGTVKGAALQMGTCGK